MKHIIIVLAILLATFSCTTTRVPGDEVPEQLVSNPEGNGQELEIEMIRGEGHNHPLMAVWVEDLEGNFIQTLFVSESIGKGVFRHGDASEGFWKPGEIRRPAALPYWGHKRGIRAEDGLFLPSPAMPVADAYTGPTPGISFILNTRLNQRMESAFNVLFEINQTWDWNEYWTNNKYPDDEEYKTSCQPAVVYEARINPENTGSEIEMKVIGRSHHSGASGELFEDLHTLSTALHIADEIVITLVD